MARCTEIVFGVLLSTGKLAVNTSAILDPLPAGLSKECSLATCIDTLVGSAEFGASSNGVDNLNYV